MLSFLQNPSRIFLEPQSTIVKRLQYWNTAAPELAEEETCAQARTEGFDEGGVFSDFCFPQSGFALFRDCAENKSHTKKPRAPKPYRCAASSVEGFIQQLAVSYIGRGYWFYVAGTIPAGTDPLKVDRELISKYEITSSKNIRSKQKKEGKARIQYLRFGSFFVLLATLGTHRLSQEQNAIKDVRRNPIRFGGYSVSYRQGYDGTWHASVRIENWEFKLLKKRFIEMATKTSFEILVSRFEELAFTPYAPVRDQYQELLRKVNKARKCAGLELLPYEVLPKARRVVKPFD